MKLSKKEQVLLTGVGALLLGVAYYQFIFSPQLQHNTELTQKAATLSQEVQAAEQTVATIETKKNQKSVIMLDVEAQMKEYYDTLTQEQIILDLNKLLSDHQLTGKIDFSPIVVTGVASLGVGTPPLDQSQIGQQVETYREALEGAQGGVVEEQQPEVEEPVENPEESSDQAETQETATATTVEQQQINVSIQGQYNNIQKFVKQLETYSQRIIITNSEFKALAEGNVSATLALEIYALPNLQAQAQSWGLNGTYGKDVPFSNLGTAYTQTLITADENKRDFLGIVKSSYSDLSSFMLGKADDSEKQSYLVTDQNNRIEASIRLSQIDGQYAYTYSVGQESYPLKGQQEVFTPKSQYIVIDLISEAIVDQRDTTKLALKVENKTDKQVVIFIRNDDQQAPRIEILDVAENVTVVKQ